MKCTKMNCKKHSVNKQSITKVIETKNNDNDLKEFVSLEKFMPTNLYDKKKLTSYNHSYNSFISEFSTSLGEIHLQFSIIFNDLLSEYSCKLSDAKLPERLLAVKYLEWVVLGLLTENFFEVSGKIEEKNTEAYSNQVKKQAISAIRSGIINILVEPIPLGVPVPPQFIGGFPTIPIPDTDFPNGINRAGTVWGNTQVAINSIITFLNIANAMFIIEEEP